MRKNFIQTLAMAALATAAPIFGQCPANPLTALSGTWTFNIQGTQTYGDDFVIAGQFTASVGADRAGNPIGLLAINATSVFNQSSTRLERDAGRYQVNESCSGGTLTMNLSSRPVQYDWVFVNGGRSIYIISTTPGRAATGSASPAPAGCPAGLTNPLALLSGSWTFSLRQDPAGSFTGAYGIAGRFEASIGVDRGGNPIGVLAITGTSNVQAGGTDSVTRLEKDAGRFQVNDDCTGGTLTFNLSSQPVQYQFYFRAGFTEIDIVSTSNRPVYGTAYRSGGTGCAVVNPLTLLTSNGGAWTFNVQTITKDNADANWAAIGRWVASTAVDRGGNTVGVLAINATSMVTTPGGNQASASARLENDRGSFQIWDDCTGGTLTMNLSSFPMQYDFWFYNNGQSIVLVSTSPGKGAVGSAHLGVTGCPAGLTDPLNLVQGIYSAKLQKIPNFTTEAYGLVGLLSASIRADRANNPFGHLAIIATSSLGFEGSITRIESDQGKYAVDADCTGGVMNFNLSSRPAEYHYYFRAGFQTMDVISLKGPAAFGVISRY